MTVRMPVRREEDARHMVSLPVNLHERLAAGEARLLLRQVAWLFFAGDHSIVSFG